MVIRSPHPDVEIPDVSLYDFLFASLTEADLARTAVVDGPTGATTSYGELRAQVDALAGAFAARGHRPGDVVALHCPNVPAFVAVFHGLLRAGITVTTINALASGAEVAKQLAASGATALVTVSALLPAAQGGADAVGLARDAVVVLDGAEGHPGLRDLLTAGAPAPDVTLDPATHLAVLPYSSGTTGLPKGVMLTHRNLVANVLQAEPFIPLTPDDVIPAVLPFFHIYGMTVLMNGALYQRSTVVTLPRFDLAEYLRVVAEHRATVLFVAPPIALAVAKHPLAAQADLSSVRLMMSGAAPFDEHLAALVGERLPQASVTQGYGMSEMSPVSHTIPVGRDDLSPGSIGLLVPNMLARVVDPATGEEIDVPAEGMSAPGELLCAGPNVMVGYLGDEQSTRDTITADGFLHTGDIVTVDADGAFYVVDRLKELIKYKGYQVPPAELEALLLAHPQIADAAVVGVPDGAGEEVPKAFVVVADGAALTADDVMAYVAAQVAPYKKVRLVEFTHVIPKSAAGKILRKELRAA
ncbi:acyl-CoA synthetase (AMP-forming)/AMP-acid ligase II [Isoptericola jiangsuensis]|uniref:Acyl-CoA synthetase (AMP-forming)/AMP-acid ligase II n=1 Tax=Isoptericola jiangsuensis TaxID=548579 RepID=A0A2A9EYW1_9MICO|nr:AMP-binding protein [Isoptericola jiangsuensis]PFG43731.1 acyl-CoA synthetase (AMP-forming)/AMP-acid ligase II [Isoptericola jiangsuensis]